MPGFQKGNPGRPKGSRNKLTVARELFEKLGFDPLKDAVAELAAFPKEDHVLRFDKLMELVRYCYPIPKERLDSGEVEIGDFIIFRPTKPEEKKDE